MKNIVVFLGKLMSQRSALITSLAAKGSTTDADLRKLGDLQSAITAVRQVLEAKREKTVPAPATSAAATNAQTNAKRMISR